MHLKLCGIEPQDYWRGVIAMVMLIFINVAVSKYINVIYLFNIERFWKKQPMIHDIDDSIDIEFPNQKLLMRLLKN